MVPEGTSLPGEPRPWPGVVMLGGFVVQGLGTLWDPHSRTPLRSLHNSRAMWDPTEGSRRRDPAALPGGGSHGETVTSCAPRAAGAARPLRRARPWPGPGLTLSLYGKTLLQTRPPSSAGGPPAPDANPPAPREGKTHPAPGASPPSPLGASPHPRQRPRRHGREPDPSYPSIPRAPAPGAGAASPPGHGTFRPCTG